MENSLKRIFGYVMLVMTGVLITSYAFPVDTGMIAISVAFGWFVFGNATILQFLFLNGHGVKIRNHWRWHGLPIWFLIYCGILFGMLLKIMNVNTGAELMASTTANVNIFAISGLIGLAASLAFWFTNGFYLTFFGSEYDARMEFKALGYDKPTTEEKIAKLHRMGVFGEWCDEEVARIEMIMDGHPPEMIKKRLNILRRCGAFTPREKEQRSCPCC